MDLTEEQALMVRTSEAGQLKERQEADTSIAGPDALDVLRGIAVNLMFGGADMGERSQWTIEVNTAGVLDEAEAEANRFGESIVLAMAESGHDLFSEWLEPVNFESGLPLNALDRLRSLDLLRKSMSYEESREALRFSPTEYNFACAIVDALEARGRSELLTTTTDAEAVSPGFLDAESQLLDWAAQLRAKADEIEATTAELRVFVSGHTEATS